MREKIIVILGPTSSGKTALAVKLAAKFNGEIISADSRQVYRGMDVGTGKDLQEYNFEIRDSKPEISKKFKVQSSPARTRQAGRKFKFQIPYHLIDVADPKKYFDLAQYQKLAQKAIDDILKRGKLPIIAGGTGLYLQALVDGYSLPKAKPDQKLRRGLEKMEVGQLFSELKKINPKFALKINESDRKNKRRLVRYIEVSKLPKISEINNQNKKPSPEKKYEFLILGIKVPKEILDQRIKKRLFSRLEKEGMVAEVERLREQGVSYKRLLNFGLEYKHIALYLQDKLEYEDMTERLLQAIKKFARKQMTWYRRWERLGKKINWIEDYKEAEKLAGQFLNDELSSPQKHPAF